MKRSMLALALLAGLFGVAWLIDRQSPAAPTAKRFASTLGTIFTAENIAASGTITMLNGQGVVSTPACTSTQIPAWSGTAWACSAASSGGITNGAGNNVIPKSNGTNIVASSITDDGTTINLGSSNLLITDASGAINSNGKFSTGSFMEAGSYYSGASDGGAYLDISGLGFGFTANALATLIINHNGYSQGATQFRNLEVDDGKGAQACLLTGSTKTLNCTGLQVGGAAVTVLSGLTGGTIPTSNGGNGLSNSTATDDLTTFTIGDNAVVSGTLTMNGGTFSFGPGTATVGGHLRTVAKAPSSLASCGTGSPAVTAGSTDTAGQITEGATATGCAMSFTTTYTTAPICVCSSTSNLSVGCSASATVLTIANTSATGDVINYVCMGH